MPIYTGYKQIIKMSEFILSTPVIFASLTDPKCGPSLAHAIVNIMTTTISRDASNIEYNFKDDEWRKYTSDNDIDKYCMR